MTSENSSDVWRDDEHGHRLQVYPHPHQSVILRMCSRHSVQQCSVSLPSQHRLQCLKGETRCVKLLNCQPDPGLVWAIEVKEGTYRTLRLQNGYAFLISTSFSKAFAAIIPFSCLSRRRYVLRRSSLLCPVMTRIDWRGTPAA